jgi:tetratricopeptide (TPR) repeat protein
MIRRVLLCLAVLGAAATPALAESGSAVCDPDQKAVDQAIKLRDSNQSVQAAAALKPVLSAHPNNFRAEYVMGTVQIQQGDQKGGLMTLNRAAAQLPAQSHNCVVNYGWYSIYNTLGVEYYKQGDRADALKNYKLADQHLNELQPNTRRDVLSNLGLLSFSEGDAPGATRWYQEAQKAGDPKAAARLSVVQSVSQSAQMASKR